MTRCSDVTKGTALSLLIAEKTSQTNKFSWTLVFQSLLKTSLTFLACMLSGCTYTTIGYLNSRELEISAFQPITFGYCFSPG